MRNVYIHARRLTKHFFRQFLTRIACDLTIHAARYCRRYLQDKITVIADADDVQQTQGQRMLDK